MKVEYVPKPGSRDLFRIVVDEEAWREVHRVIFGRKQRLPECVSDLAELEAACAVIEFGSAKRYALWRLSRWAQCSAEIAEALAKYCVSQATCERVLAYLVDAGFLNDEDYVQRLVAHEQARGKGPGAIRAKLYRKGISGELAQEAVAVVDHDAQRAAVRKLLASSRYARRNLADPRERQKVLGSLARRGFSFDVISAELCERGNDINDTEILI